MRTSLEDCEVQPLLWSPVSAEIAGILACHQASVVEQFELEPHNIVPASKVVALLRRAVQRGTPADDVLSPAIERVFDLLNPKYDLPPVRVRLPEELERYRIDLDPLTQGLVELGT